MQEFTCQKGCAECCGPVPVSQRELQELKEVIREMPRKRVQQLKSQKRDSLTCLLLDTKTKSCSVYEHRPKVCQMFGYYQGMTCPQNPSFATKSRGAGDKALKDTMEHYAGTLTTQIKWEDLLR